MKQKLFGYFRTNRKGLALISVLGVVTLATILILALFSVSDTEFKSAKSYADGAVARQLADNAVNLVVSQIQAAATGSGVLPSGSHTIWASQPGGVRVYRSDGSFAVGRRLYSSNNMVYTGTSEDVFSKSAPEQQWDSKPGQWVDLNAPVIKTNNVFFPIVDPRASKDMGSIHAIEGFSYSNDFSSNVSGGAGGPGVTGQLNGVVDSGNLQDLRVPMPVEWLYVLRDGSMGTVSSSGGGEYRWVSAAGTAQPTRENPIIGRVGFWADDESCRVNINTAGEPGFYATPTVFHGRDWNWANNQPSIFEYQRYPGHPATVALSSVLYPNPAHSTGIYDADSYPSFPTAYRELKDKIYELAPKLAKGGSADGSLSFAPDDFNANASPELQDLFTGMQLAKAEHPYISVDELIFRNGQTSSTNRDLTNSNVSGVGNLVTPEALERSRFFLTAQSRAPETNMFGYPRISIWPVPDEGLGPKFRTVFDSSIAYAGQLGGNINNAYYFRRRDANSAVVDIGADAQSSPAMQRNGKLMTYLDYMISATNVQLPGGGNFLTKYGQDARQILVEIFDYIRTTNLYDSFLDQQYVDENGGKRDFWDDGDNGEGQNADPAAKKIKMSTEQARLWKERPKEFSYYTYTAPRFDTLRRVGDLQAGVPSQFSGNYKNVRVATGMYPGHGQVRPIEWVKEGFTYRGLGRFPTISELALHFICTADGRTDASSFTNIVNGEEIRSGGKTAKKIDPAPENVRLPFIEDSREQFWYSNIPPEPTRQLFEKWGCSFGNNVNVPNHVTRHPGWKAKNWNCSLEPGVELAEDEKRVQLAIQVEMFMPSVGYTKYAPDFTMVLDGDSVSNLKVKTASGNFVSVFDTTAKAVVQSTAYYFGAPLGEYSASNVNPTGGSYGTTVFMANRAAKSWGKMPDDPGYSSAATSDPHGQMVNFSLVSNFFTVKRTGNLEFRLQGGKPVKLELYASHDYMGDENKKNSTPTQTFEIQIPDGQVPVPKLVVYSTEHRRYVSNGSVFNRNAVQAPRWWGFNQGGVVNRFEGEGRLQGGSIDWKTGVQPHAFRDGDMETRGRFYLKLEDNYVNSRDPNNKWTRGADGGVPMNSVVYGYSPTTYYAGVQSRPSDEPNEDTFSDQGGTMGNYAFYGSDSIRSMVPRHGDYRVIAGRKVVPVQAWVPHRVWTERPSELFAHSLTGAVTEAGFDTGAPSPGGDITKFHAQNRMVMGAWYPTTQLADTPNVAAQARKSTVSGDFDNGIGNIKDGPYINKPDEGNLSVGQMWYGNNSSFAVTRNAYFLSNYLQFPPKNSFFTPNRLLPSPVMFGSLPTGVFGSLGDADEKFSGVPWRTLLFRPSVPGDPAQSSWKHAGSIAPKDHYFLDLFWMPVVEPYAISDNFSTAGKINLNYQMLGFPHITRATALHAAMKGELITGFSQRAVKGTTAPSETNTMIYKTAKTTGNLTANSAIEMWGNGDTNDWHRRINIPATLRQLENRFYARGVPAGGGAGAFNGLLRTASQLCEMHLVPMPSTSPTLAGSEGLALATDKASTTQINAAMSTYWQYNNVTGDNVRERPYASLYQKFTTRSNTFRVYFIAQTIRKAKSVDPTMLDESKDTVTAEYRGSALLERYLGSNLLDYAANESISPFSQPSLEHSYHYRVLEMKQFSP